MTRPITDDEAARRMEALLTGDEEIDHLGADALLCEVLTSLGYAKTVEAFEQVGKWYA